MMVWNKILVGVVVLVAVSACMMLLGLSPDIMTGVGSMPFIDPHSMPFIDPHSMPFIDPHSMPFIDPHVISI